MLPGASGLLGEKADGHNMPSPSVTQGIVKALLSQIGEELAKCVLHWTEHNYPKYSRQHLLSTYIACVVSGSTCNSPIK